MFFVSFVSTQGDVRLHFSPANVAYQTHFTFAVEAVLVVVQEFCTRDFAIAVGVTVTHNVVRGNGKEGHGPLEPRQQVVLAPVHLRIKPLA